MIRDDRGRGFYDIFPHLPQGQINISTTYSGVIRAFRRHQSQWGHWYIVEGDAQIALYDDVAKELHIEYFSGGGEIVIDIPPRIWHGFKALGDKPLTVLYYVSNKYDPNSLDEERVAYNKFFDWEPRYK